MFLRDLLKVAQTCIDRNFKVYVWNNKDPNEILKIIFPINSFTVKKDDWEWNKFCYTHNYNVIRYPKCDL